MLRQSVRTAAARLAPLVVCLSVVFLPPAARAQTAESMPELKRQAADLMRRQKYTDALPLIEKITAAEPNDADWQYFHGFALIAKANVTKDAAARRALRVRARGAFVKSKELGVQEPNVTGLIQSLPPDGGEGAAFSQNAEANGLMVEAEALFSQGKLDEALKNYASALRLDPKLYEAALFTGDVYTQRGDYAQAEIWYQRAIGIDPNRETAYRYSATPLMRQRKYDQARDRYVEAFIKEPYNNLTAGGLTQWANATNTRLAHPRIDVPTNVTFDEKGDAKINIDAGALLGGKDDGSSAWISYGAARSAWHKGKFAAAFPNEKKYRHSLAEEVDALRSVLSLAASDKQVKALSPSLAKLKKLNDEGLLEAYVLLAIPDEGIAQDYRAYLAQNREKLRRYVTDYILTGGGK
ncbi:MAG: tetratricopeptide repeat protein [Acidobacteria bacterium]|nr:tetratricopeptide repeat protein [Acidobacteriota bacterium]MCA1641703.1 tetratricopeptide repeat protein [Acidobacteriota bacterium]